MMQVQVKLFATLREQAGWAQQGYSLPEGATVETLLETLEADAPDLRLRGRAVYAAVNQQYAQRSAVLQDGDEVALFPPVSGGAGASEFGIQVADGIRKPGWIL